MYFQPLNGLLDPAYARLTAVALTEAEARYGPLVIGFTVGLFAFVLYLGRVVHRK